MMISKTHWNVHMMVEIVVETMSIHNIAANANVLKVENSEMLNLWTDDTLYCKVFILKIYKIYWTRLLVVFHHSSNLYYKGRCVSVCSLSLLKC